MKDHPDGTSLPSALECLDRLREEVAGRRPAFFLDYDGTLTPIVDRPEDALLPPACREVLARLARRHPVAVVSGRDRADVEALVSLDGLIHAGSHGFDIGGPGGLRLEHPEGLARLDALEAAGGELQKKLAGVPGAHVERKRFSVAVHDRLVADGEREAVALAAAEAARRHPGLALFPGKRVHELRPDAEWDKGRAVRWLLEALDLAPGRGVPFYLGDDLTDEDAFREIREDGIGILVGRRDGGTHARYGLANPDEVRRFLTAAAEWPGVYWT